MARNPIFSFLNLGAVTGGLGLGTPAPAERTPAENLFELRRQALETAKRNAEGENPPRKPTMLDYYQSALTLSDQARELGVTWNAATIADLSGQRLDGFDMRLAHMRLPAEGTPERAAVMEEMRGFVRPDHIPQRPQGVDAMVDAMNLDGDNAIGAFFAAAEGHLRFDRTIFTNTNFHPATTLRLMENAVGAQFANVNLYGIEEGESLVLGTPRGAAENERYRNVTVHSANGGTVHVNGNAIVDGLTIHNGHPVLEVASRGQVNNLIINPQQRGQENSAPVTTLLTLRLEENAKLWRPQLNDVTLSPDSNLEGGIIEGNVGMDGHFTGFRRVNMQGVSFDGAQIIALTFEDANMRGASFEGAGMRRLVINGQADLSESDFARAHLHDVSFTQGNLTEANFERANLGSVRFQNANLTNADFDDARIENLTATGTNFSRSDFSDVFINRGEFTNSNFQQAHFSEAEILNSSFTGSDLSNANFRGATLSMVTFTDSNLAGVDFTGANISNVTININGQRRVVNSVEELQAAIAAPVRAPQVTAPSPIAGLDLAGLIPASVAGLTLGGGMPMSNAAPAIEPARSPVELTQMQGLTMNPGGLVGSGAENFSGGDQVVQPQQPSTISGGVDIAGGNFQEDSQRIAENGRALTTPAALEARVNAIMAKDRGDEGPSV